MMGFRYRLQQIKPGALIRVFRKFTPQLRPHRRKLGASLFAALGVALMTLARPWPLKIVIDNVLIPRSAPSSRGSLDIFQELDAMTIILLATGAVLVIAALRGLLVYAREVMAKSVGHQVIAEIRLAMFSHIQRLPQSYHDYRQTGELMTRLTGDMNLLQELLVDTVVSLGTQLIIIAGMLAIMFWLDWQLALVGLIALPAFLIAAYSYSDRIQISAKKQREKYGKMVATVQESFAGISQVKGFASEKQREKEVGKSLGRDLKTNLRTTKLSAGYSRTVEMITAAGAALALLIGAYRALEGEISAGDLIVFLSYLRGVYRPVQTVARLTGKISKALVRADKIIEVFEMKPEALDRADAVSASGITGDIHFNSVSFSYAHDQSILRDVTLHIPAGQTTVIMGPTGAGKSTIAKLILRLYDANRGSITIDGRELAEFRIRSLRKRITPMTQETFLFRSTIADNIAFGKRGATPDEIRRAAQLSGADSFIQQLPDGYNTLVGESGATLSGGQRQLISFARAALRDTPIMIFDEPAAGLDVETEERAREALRRLKDGRTMIIVSHRLNMLDLADHLIMIDQGMVVQEGEPVELRNHEGMLRDFVMRDCETMNETVTQ